MIFIADKFTYEYVKEYIENEGFILLSKEYKRTHDKLTLQCKNGHIFEVSFNNFKRGRRCRKCSNEKLRKERAMSTDEFIELVNINYNGNFTVLGEYINRRTDILIKCNICNSEPFYVKGQSLINGRHKLGCPNCSPIRNTLKSNKEFTDEFYDLVGNEYTILSKYKGNKKKITVRHNCESCGNYEYEATPSHFLSGERCPKCSISKGEKRISEYLINNYINHIPQKTYDGLLGVGNGNLSYDFYLPQHNMLIEYQGEFHDGTAYQQTNKEFIRQQEHDRRKKQYAIDNNIKLLEIWYWDYDNIEEILNKELNIKI